MIFLIILREGTEQIIMLGFSVYGYAFFFFSFLRITDFFYQDLLLFLKFYIVTLIPVKNHECRRICETNRKNYGISMNKRVI